MRSLPSRLRLKFAVACLCLAASPAYAQLPRTISTTLTVKVMAREFVNGALFPVRRAIVCVGDSTDTRRFGHTQMLNDSGEVRFEGIPLGTNLVITAYLEESLKRPPLGGRVVTNMRSTREVAEVHWELWKGGPTCGTPVRSKDAASSVGVPQLSGRFTTASGSLARLRRVELFSRTASGVNYVEVNGGATEYRTSQRSDFSGSVWVATAPTPPGQPRGLRAISHEISGAAGRKTIYVQLRNAAGTSPVYSVELDFLDLYTCKLAYRRAPNATANMTMSEEQLSVLRAQSKTLDVSWPSSNEGKPGYGMHLRYANNAGEHPIELTVGGGLVWNKVILQPNETRYIRADMRAVRCP